MDEILKAYRTLGLDPGASPKAVKKAYRSLVKTWHPDRHVANPAARIEAEEKTKGINLAFERLQDFEVNRLAVMPPQWKPSARANPPRQRARTQTAPSARPASGGKFRSRNTGLEPGTPKSKSAKHWFERGDGRWFKPLTAIGAVALLSLLLVARFHDEKPGAENRILQPSSLPVSEQSPGVFDRTSRSAPQERQMSETHPVTNETAQSILERDSTASRSLPTDKSAAITGSAQPGGQSNVSSEKITADDEGRALANALAAGLRESAGSRAPGRFDGAVGSISSLSSINPESSNTETNLPRLGNANLPGVQLSARLTNAIASLQATEQIRSALEAKRKEIDQSLSVSQNDPIAHYQLGIQYLQGTGATQDFGAAAQHFRRAAEAGHPAAQKQLGYLYAMGKGVPQDRREAAKWFQKAAEQGSEGATFAGALLDLGRIQQQRAGIAIIDEKKEPGTNTPSLREVLKNIQIRNAKPETKTNVEADPIK